jgi:hypothetical protein
MKPNQAVETVTISFMPRLYSDILRQLVEHLQEYTAYSRGPLVICTDPALPMIEIAAAKNVLMRDPKLGSFVERCRFVYAEECEGYLSFQAAIGRVSRAPSGTDQPSKLVTNFHPYLPPDNFTIGVGILPHGNYPPKFENVQVNVPWLVGATHKLVATKST